MKTRISGWNVGLRLLLALLLAGPVEIALAQQPAPESEAEQEITLSAAEEATRQELEVGLGALEKMPESVIKKGPEAMSRWLQENGFQAQVAAAGVVTCAGAIVVALVSNGLGFLKILKIRAALKAAGGAKKFASTVIKAYKKFKRAGKSSRDAVRAAVAEAGGKGGGEAVKALLEFFSINAVLSACFGL